MVYLLLFVVHAVEASRVRRRAAEAEAEGALGSSGGMKELAEQAQLAENLAAKASKFLEISRQGSSFFGGTLGAAPGDAGQYGFNEFEALRSRERLNRGEAVEPASARPSTPAA